jgi:hypothetical protein
MKQYANPPEKIKTSGGIVFSRRLYYPVDNVLEMEAVDKRHN